MGRIDALVRRRLYLQVTDPGAKSIVFSASEDLVHSEHYSVWHVIKPSMTAPLQYEMVIDRALARNGMCWFIIHLYNLLTTGKHAANNDVFGQASRKIRID